MMALSPLNQRRWRIFRANKRSYYALILFSALYLISLFSEVLSNDHPLLVSYQGQLRAPFISFYSEADYGGDFKTEANYRDPVVQCLIRTGGVVEPVCTSQAPYCPARLMAASLRCRRSGCQARRS